MGLQTFCLSPLHGDRYYGNDSAMWLAAMFLPSLPSEGISSKREVYVPGSSRERHREWCLVEKAPSVMVSSAGKNAFLTVLALEGKLEGEATVMEVGEEGGNIFQVEASAYLKVQGHVRTVC